MLRIGHDPLMKYSWFPESENLYLSHAHEIFYSFVFYNVCHQIVAPILNRMFFRSHYSSIKDKYVKVDFDVHTVSMIQAAVSLFIIWPTLFLPNNLNVVTYHGPLTSMVASLTIGYFLWDLLVCIRYFRVYGFEFLAHAVGSLYVMLLVLKPFCQPWVGKFLLYEASTPFVNINWYIIQLTDPITKKCIIPMWINVLNGLVLMATFGLVRLCWGSIATLILGRQMWLIKDQLPRTSSIAMLVLNVVMNSMNFMWFSKMIRIAKKLANGSKNKRD
ncbi:hypothetical protein NCAS_0H00360 [Naumovozyma castellii]|uniref:TLC domain-containing protein n=1 Tax=Naumovozyma castellii TaxID=27288 RepID=G0VIM1_NAUCA|nr:hypothetical protein NCAS_0H00360 [Naumovozyma castellii CBS 4309]CCC71346.1 hypothetical protein NCAS_0H00360 [Naumovozyma castellii CBS 4309]